MKQRYIIILIALCAVTAAAAILWHYNKGAALTRDGAFALLVAAGFTGAALPAPSRSASGLLLFEDTRLDEDGFSSIGAIHMPAAFPPLPRQTSKDVITIDDVNLIGAYEPAAGLSVSGWQAPVLSNLELPARIIVNGAKIDLDTPEGSLRLSGKGDLYPRPEGGVALRGLLWAVQNQTRFESRVNAQIHSGGKWLAEMEFDNAAINFKLLKSSRLSGWLTLENNGGDTPRLTGQFNAGKFSYGPLDFASPIFSLKNDTGDYRIEIQATIPGFEGMTINGIIKPGDWTAAFELTIATKSADDMMSFLRAITEKARADFYFSRMALTASSIDDAGQQIESLDYDMLMLDIAGTPDDYSIRLSTALTADGVTRRHVISLDAP